MPRRDEPPIGAPGAPERPPATPSAADGATPSAAALQALDLDAALRDPDGKQAFVTPMFEHIAPRYDAFTRLFSFGMDARWKGTLVEWSAALAPAPSAILDVACGTGDLALLAAAAHPSSTVLGIDAAVGMIARARQRVPSDQRARLRFDVGDLTGLPLPSDSVDLVLGGYALRNVPRYEAALAELSRVLRPGGALMTLDFYRPPQALWRALFLGYLHLAGSAVGWWWHRAPVIYNYIAGSIRHFVTAGEFSAALHGAGFVEVARSEHLLGGIALHHARKR